MTSDTSPQQLVTPPVNQALEQALEQVMQMAAGYHHAGQHQEAKELYRGILEIQPNHADANHNLGLLAWQSDGPSAGLAYLATALQAQPLEEPYWYSYLDALFQAN
jgi:protein O-GlcNAc transferase